MRRSISAVFVAVIAAFLSFALAVPANAADAWVPEQKKIPAEVRYKYGYDYYKQSFGGSKSWTLQPVGDAVHPSNKPKLPANRPIAGRIVEPGKTPVKIPSVYKPTLVAPTAGAFGLSRFFGLVTVGAGGEPPIPANAVELYKTKGVNAECAEAFGAGNASSACAAADYKSMMQVNGCTLDNTCNALGAVDGNGNPLADFFKMDVIPMLSDLWAKITGQTSDDGPKIDRHYEVQGGACTRHIVFDHSGDPLASGFIRPGPDGEIHRQRPADPAQGQLYDSTCGHLLDLKQSGAVGLATTCMDADGNIASSGGTPYGKIGNLGNTFDITGGTGQQKEPLCSNMTAGMQLFSVVIYQSVQTVNSTDSMKKYFQWVNPNIDLDTINNTEISTTVSCKTADGQYFNYTTSVKSVSGVPAPQCPAGSVMEAFETTKKDPGNRSNTKLGGAIKDPVQAEKYPDCMGADCALTVEIDGNPCTVGNADCAKWPQIQTTAPSRVVCKWGSYTVPASDCTVIGNAYQPNSTGVIHDPASGAWVSIDANGAPSPTANPQPWNPVNPAPVPGTTPGTGTGTDTGTGTTPGTGGQAGSDPNETGCFPSGWAAFNPVEWVKQPVGCALREAFVPTPATVTSVTGGMQNKINSVGFAPIVNTWLATYETAGGSAGCAGPTVHFSMNGVEKTLQPFQACTQPMATVAGVAYAVSCVVIVLFGGLGVARAVAAAFGLNFSMGRGSDVDA